MLPAIDYTRFSYLVLTMLSKSEPKVALEFMSIGRVLSHDSVRLAAAMS